MMAALVVVADNGLDVGFSKIHTDSCIDCWDWCAVFLPHIQASAKTSRKEN
jgi:hypothetical protein